MTDRLTADSFQGVLRIANFVIVLLIGLGLMLPRLLVSADSYETEVLQVLCFLVLLSLVLADGVLLFRHRSWGRAHGAAVVVALAASAVPTAVLPSSLMVGPAHWALHFGAWVGVLLLAVARLQLLVAFLAGHYGLALLLVMTAGADQQLIIHFLLATIPNVGLQLTLGAAMWALRRMAAVASDAAQRSHEAGTADALAEALQADRSERYRAIRDTAAPLLRGLADGRLRPSEPEVQRRCAVEAARMRRLFAETDETGDPLLNELGAAVGVAERGGIVVTQAELGRWPVPPREARRSLVDDVAAALLDARSAARVTVDGDDDGVVLSVVTDGGGRAPPGDRQRGDVQTSTVIRGEQVWMQARWVRAPALTP